MKVLEKYSNELFPYLLDILNSLSDFICPKSYSKILLNEDSFEKWNKENNCYIYIMDKLKNNKYEIYLNKLNIYYNIANEKSKNELCEWYKNKINLILNETDIISNAFFLCEEYYNNIKNIPNEDILLIKNIEELYILIYEREILIDMSFDKWISYNKKQKISIILQDSYQYVNDIYSFIFPLIELSKKYNIEDKYYDCLKEYIIEKSKYSNKLYSILEIFKTSTENSNVKTRIIKSDEEVKDMILTICNNYNDTTSIDILCDIIDCISTAFNNLMQIKEIKNCADISLLLYKRYNIPVCINDYKKWKDTFNIIKDKNISVEYKLIKRICSKPKYYDFIKEDIKIIHKLVFNYININDLYKIFLYQLLQRNDNDLNDELYNINNLSYVKEILPLINNEEQIKVIIDISNNLLTEITDINQIKYVDYCLSLIKTNDEAIIKQKQLVDGIKMLNVFNCDITPAEIVLTVDKYKILNKIINENPNSYLIDNNYLPGYHLLEFSRLIGLNNTTKVKLQMAKGAIECKDYQTSHQFCMELILSKEINEKEDLCLLCDICYDIAINNTSISEIGKLELLRFAISYGDCNIIDKCLSKYNQILFIYNKNQFIKQSKISFESIDEIIQKWTDIKLFLNKKNTKEQIIYLYSLLLSSNKIDAYNILLEIYYPNDIISSFGILCESIINEYINYNEIIKKYSDLNQIKGLLEILLMIIGFKVTKSESFEKYIDNYSLENINDSIKSLNESDIIQTYKSLYNKYMSIIQPENGNTEIYYNYCISSINKPNSYDICIKYIKILSNEEFCVLNNQIFKNTDINIQKKYLLYYYSECKDKLCECISDTSNNLDLDVIVIFYKLLLSQNHNKNELLNTYKIVILMTFFKDIINNKDNFYKYTKEPNKVFQKILNEDSTKIFNLLLIWDKLYTDKPIYNNIDDIYNDNIIIDYIDDKKVLITTLTKNYYEKILGNIKKDNREISPNENNWFIYLYNHYFNIKDTLISLFLFHTFKLLSSEKILELYNSIREKEDEYEYGYFILSLHNPDIVMKDLNNKTKLMDLKDNNLLYSIILSKIDCNILLSNDILYNQIIKSIFNNMKEWLNETRAYIPFVISIQFLIVKLILSNKYIEAMNLYKQYTGLNNKINDIEGQWMFLKLYISRLTRIDDNIELEHGWEYAHSLIVMANKKINEITI